MMMQSNLGCGIMVTLRIDSSMACVEPMLSNCFNEGPLVDCRTDMDFLIPRYCSKYCGICMPDRSSNGAALVKRQLGGTCSFYGS